MNKRIGLASGLLALALLCPAVAGAAVVNHFNANGEYAAASTDDGAGYSSQVSVYRGGTTRAPETYLNYYWSSCAYEGTVFSCSGENGWGLIPNGAFRATARSASVDVDTAGLTNTAFSWSYDYATDTYTFQEWPSAGGRIAVAWTKSAEFSARFTGTSEQNYLNFKFISNGSQQSSSARASGTLFGAGFAGNGELGRSRGVSISIEK